ncbi:low affinity immunoglobulin gamma Fc region receptor II-like [Carassius carassius]|uniref:low affinity immunoglobulin gamma Fc region receptor II-like n=1 Tax=Carassius carassius TaxID=217509 RepID=UPI0028697745|nr:low affinity immunoglobulin gamma Fc region receptor II-like [Carassius carassius]
MELSLLPLMLWQEASLAHKNAPKPRLTVKNKRSQIFRGDTVELECELKGYNWKYTFQCGDKQHNYYDDDFKITVELTQSCKCKVCRDSFCSEWSNDVTLTVSDDPIVTVKPQSSVFTGDTVTLICDVGRSTGRTIYWLKNFKRIKAGSAAETLREVRVSDRGRYACTVDRKTTQSQGVMLTVRERPKPVVRVQPDGRVSRGQTVTLSCDIQQTDVISWSYSWNKDDSEIHVSQSQEYRISSVDESHTGNYSCTGRETGGSRYSHTSDKVTLTVSESSGLVFSEAGVIAGLSVTFLLIFALVLLWCCKHKGAGSPCSSTDHQPQNIRQTSEQKTSGQTPPQSDTIYGPSYVSYVKIHLKSMNEIKKKKKDQGTESYDTVYSKLKI